MLQWQNWVVVKVTMWHQKLKIFTTLPFIEKKMCWPLHYIIRAHKKADKCRYALNLKTNIFVIRCFINPSIIKIVDSVLFLLFPKIQKIITKVLWQWKWPLCCSMQFKFCRKKKSRIKRLPEISQVGQLLSHS